MSTAADSHLKRFSLQVGTSVGRHLHLFWPHTGAELCASERDDPRAILRAQLAFDLGDVCILSRTRSNLRFRGLYGFMLVWKQVFLYGFMLVWTQVSRARLTGGRHARSAVTHGTHLLRGLVLVLVDLLWLLC